jgi:hypothetical protein
VKDKKKSVCGSVFTRHLLLSQAKINLCDLNGVKGARKPTQDQFVRLERCQGSKETHNRIMRGGTFCDVVCNVSTKDAQVNWKPMELNQGFELTTTSCS